MNGVESLKRVVVFRKGDTIRHRATGREYVVKYVQIAKYDLTLMTEDGIGFDSEVVEKVVKDKEGFNPDLSMWF